MWQGAGFLSYAYTTEQTEKVKVKQYAKKYGSIKKGIQVLAGELLASARA
ncbi:TraG/VirB4 family ATPase [Dyadobacter luteus]